ncbi:hypothetical protein ACD661_16560 [Legionella lytica]|uniref:Uncharacterized protein n=1 Tax=Legionella lytica TaxID=96232 RepID=A0ABW8DBR4_9GAMM
MHSQNYVADRFFRKSLRQKFEKKQLKENSQITIRDLVVLPENYKLSYGESKNIQKLSSDKENTSYTRLVDHIECLAEIVNQTHQNAYCKSTDNGNFYIKKDYTNHITRLSLNEFSLYTSKPLSLAEFCKFIEKLKEVAGNCHENVHLVLSSFSVVDKDLLNVVVYLQGGKESKINIITKSSASAGDVNYDGAYGLFSQQKYRSNMPSRYIAGESEFSSVISNNSVFHVQTYGGAHYTQAIDICSDHDNKHSRKLLLQDLNVNKARQLIPKQSDQILTANSIWSCDSSKITPNIVHVDPYPYLHLMGPSIPLDEVGPFLLSSSLLKSKEYPSMILIKPTDQNNDEAIERPLSQGQITISNPPFGANYRISFHKERVLKGYVPDIASKVDKFNQIIIEKQIEDFIATRYNLP